MREADDRALHHGACITTHHWFYPGGSPEAQKDQRAFHIREFPNVSYPPPEDGKFTRKRRPPKSLRMGFWRKMMRNVTTARPYPPTFFSKFYASSSQAPLLAPWTVLSDPVIRHIWIRHNKKLWTRRSAAKRNMCRRFSAWYRECSALYDFPFTFSVQSGIEAFLFRRHSSRNLPEAWSRGCEKSTGFAKLSVFPHALGIFKGSLETRCSMLE